jgi:hypothetical protein
MSEQTSVDEQPGHHEESADQEGWTTTPTIDEQESGHGHDDIDNKLNGRREKHIATQASHCEDISNVVLKSLSAINFGMSCALKTYTS